MIKITYEPPRQGWLRLSLQLAEKTIEIDASDVPNNPVQDLIDALAGAAHGHSTSVWWNLEPAGYFIYFQHVRNEVQLSIKYDDASKESRAHDIAMIQGSPAKILLPFWRFLRDFQSRSFTEPHWPDVNYDHIQQIKLQLDRQ